MQCDQIAYAVNSDMESARLKELLGLTNAPWIVDRVTAECTVWGEPKQINDAKLEFCDVLGLQFEIIRYIRGNNWLKIENGSMGPFQSHVGFHLDPMEEWPLMKGCRLAQEARTISHTCDYLTIGEAKGRFYRYKIFEVSPHNYMKFIRRIEPAMRGNK